MSLKMVLYGLNLPALYEEEQKLLDSLAQGVEQQRVDFRKITPEQLAELLGTQNIFGSPQLWRITKWESLKSPKQKLAAVQLLSETPDDVILIIPQEMTPAQKKMFDAKLWKLREFKLPKVFFQLTESIKVKPLKDVLKLFERSLEQKNEWELHALVSRQFRLLLATFAGAPVLAPPFAKAQLASQAKKFTPDQLVFALHELFRIEWQQKSGKSHLTWSQEFDRLLVKLYDNRDL